jgi:hypothetical protein
MSKRSSKTEAPEAGQREVWGGAQRAAAAAACAPPAPDGPPRACSRRPVLETGPLRSSHLSQQRANRPQGQLEEARRDKAAKAAAKAALNELYQRLRTAAPVYATQLDAGREGFVCDLTLPGVDAGVEALRAARAFSGRGSTKKVQGRTLPAAHAGVPEGQPGLLG